MGITAGAIGAGLSGVGATLGPAGVLAAGGIGLETFSMLNAPEANKIKQPGMPNAPDPNVAADSAQAQLTSQRKALLLSGGETTLTGPGGAPLLAGSTSSKTLLGVG